MRKISRRQFLKHGVGFTGTLVAVPYVIPSSAMSKNGSLPPSERITLGLIGCGNRGLYDLTHFLIESDVQCLAVCDCWESRREKAKSIIDKHHNNTDCRAHRYHEELLAREDIDAVLIATGDRWHAVMSILAAHTGKDIYCEKPYCLTIAEGRILVETTRDTALYGNAVHNDDRIVPMHLLLMLFKGEQSGSYIPSPHHSEIGAATASRSPNPFRPDSTTTGGLGRLRGPLTLPYV